jgi:thiol-disulfide isomerase/thioredoxin
MCCAGLDIVLSSKISQLKNLRILELSGNYISGPLPEEIGELVNLEILDISCQGHLGELPHSIGKLKNLKTISLNHMSGDLPKELGQLSNLEELQFYSEQHITSIPDDIYNITTLKILKLDFTQFPYTIPEAIGNLTELEHLYISYDLTGTIPESMGKLTKLKHLSLANPFPQGGESLGGDVPESLQNLEYWPYFWADVIFEHPYLNTKNLNLPAMHIQAEDLDGNAINTDEIYSNNQLTIIYSWDETCPAVTELHPILKELYSKYHGNGFDVIGYYVYYEDYMKELVNRFDLPWRNFSTVHFPFKNGDVNAPGHIIGLASVVNSSGQIVYETLTGDYNGLKKYVEKVFNSDIQLYESSNYSTDGEVTTLNTATKGEGIDIVLMGDAYSDRQIADGTYKADMENLYNNLFTEEPYKSFKDHFNVYYVNVVSATEGYEYGNTALDGYFGNGTLVGGNDNAVFDYALNAISEEEMDEALLIVAMNSDNYAGTCYMYYPESVSGTYGSGPSVSYFPRGGDAETFAQLLHHEACGHGFAKLADEYAYEDMGAVPSDYVSEIQTQQNDWGWWKNVDFTSNPTATRWSHFVNDSRYQYEGLGAFEGGLTYWSGVWRPT